MNHTLLPGYGLLRKKGVVTHVGTYLGCDQVMHLGPYGLRVDSVRVFTASQQLQVFPNEVPSDVLATRVADAWKTFTSYDVLGQNCEHLANFLQKGVRQSPQLQRAVVGGALAYGVSRVAEASPLAACFIVIGGALIASQMI